MPICNEDVTRVFAGLRATYESLARTGELDRFDFFVLSDSNDPDAASAELDAWNALCETLADAKRRIFYRRRQHRIKRKSGNIADFCRRWGAQLPLHGRARRRQRHERRMPDDAGAPDGGAIRMRASSRPPRARWAATRCSRASSSSPTSVYGPMFTAGLHYWQLGESHYWGHNAIIRRRALHGALRARAAAGHAARSSGEILSHDFVEAALMRRAGYGVWIAYDLPGSYEEMPPNLIDELEPRPPLVPGQPDERAADVRTRHAPGAPRRVPDRRDGLRVGAAVVPASCCCRRGCW